MDLTQEQAAARRERLRADHASYLRTVATARHVGNTTVYSSLARAGGTTWTEYRTEKAREDARLAAMETEALESQRTVAKQQQLRQRQEELAAGRTRRAAKRKREKEKKKNKSSSETLMDGPSDAEEGSNDDGIDDVKIKNETGNTA